MGIIERYLHAIEFWLPKGQRKDIIAEISEDVYSQVEERQEQLGHTLSEAELETLIKQRARPVVVANKYLQQQFLIGPLLFPIYLFALKIWAAMFPLIGFAVHIIVGRAQHPELGWAATIANAWSSLFSGAFTAAGVVTLIFACLERVEAKTHFLSEWNPRQLPSVRNSDEIPRSTSIFEIVFYFVATGWFAHASSFYVVELFGFRATLAPIWAYFFWGYLAVLFLSLALSVVNLTRPYWTIARALSRLGIDALGSVLILWLMKANVIAAVSIAGLEPAATEAVRNAIHLWVERSFPWAVVVVLVILAVDFYRIYRINRRRAGVGLTAAIVR